MWPVSFEAEPSTPSPTATPRARILATGAMPLEEIRRLYDFIGMPFTEEARAEMEKWRDLNRREERPSHQYTLEEYGFTEQGLKKSFHEYRERYILARPTR